MLCWKISRRVSRTEIRACFFCTANPLSEAIQGAMPDATREVRQQEQRTNEPDISNHDHTDEETLGLEVVGDAAS